VRNFTGFLQCRDALWSDVNLTGVSEKCAIFQRKVDVKLEKDVLIKLEMP